MWPQSLILTAIFWDFVIPNNPLQSQLQISTLHHHLLSFQLTSISLYPKIGQATLNAISLSLSSPTCTHLLLTWLASLVYHYIPDAHAILTPLPLLDFRTLQSNPTLANSHSIQPWIYPCAIEHGWGKRKKDNDWKRSALSLWPLNSKGSQG